MASFQTPTRIGLHPNFYSRWIPDELLRWMGSSSRISTVTDYLWCLPYLFSHQPSTVPIELQQCQPDPSNGQISSRPLQRSTFYSVLQIPPVDELPQCISDSSIGQPSIAPSEFHYRSTFYRIPHAVGLLQWTVFRRASTSDKFQMNFSSDQTPAGLLQ